MVLIESNSWHAFIVSWVFNVLPDISMPSILCLMSCHDLLIKSDWICSSVRFLCNLLTPVSIPLLTGCIPF